MPFPGVGQPRNATTIERDSPARTPSRLQDAVVPDGQSRIPEGGQNEPGWRNRPRAEHRPRQDRRHSYDREPAVSQNGMATSAFGLDGLLLFEPVSIDPQDFG
jgi:hypothetical protein